MHFLHIFIVTCNMDPSSSLQKLLFQAIKEHIPSHVSFVHDISELLGISYDSAYRRIRGEKEMTLTEVQTLCSHYHISLDALLSIETHQIMFASLAIGEQGFTFLEWLQTILKEIKEIHACKEKEIFYSAKDVPIFHYFEFPTVFAFKSFFWHKVLFSSPDLVHAKFQSEIPPETLTLVRSILSFYNRIPTVEFWNEETFDSLIRQIEFCHVCGYFKDDHDALKVLDEVTIMVDHLEKQASTGFRYFHGEKPEGVDGSYRLYCNDVLLGDNTIFISKEGRLKTFLTYNVINLLITEDPVLFRQVENSMRTLTKKSTLISSSSEKERLQFFIRLHARINRMREKIL